MENNKLLIGVQFTYSVTAEDQKTNLPAPTVRHHTLELYVLRDITLKQLMDAIKYGLRKLIRSDPTYQKCYDVFKACTSEDALDTWNERKYFNHICLGFCHQETAEKNAVNVNGEPLLFQQDEQLFLYQDSLSCPLCDLGFINSSRLIFNEIAKIDFISGVDTSALVEAFAPADAEESDSSDAKKSDSSVKIGRKITFPEYNISVRQLYRFDDTPVEIIPPQEPPKKPERSLLAMLLPSLLTLTVMMAGRTLIMMIFNGNVMSGLQMALFSGLMSMIAVVTTVLTWRGQRKEYDVSLSAWRVRYEDYIKKLMKDIRDRQENDVKKLEELYPDADELIKPVQIQNEKDKDKDKDKDKKNRSVYSLNGDIYPERRGTMIF